MEEIYVDLNNRGYPIKIGEKLLYQESSYPKGEGRKMMVISDGHVFPLYGSEVISQLEKRGWEVHSHIVPPGESSKDLNLVQGIYTLLIERGFERTSHILALGGGVVGDLAGFVSSTYLRGIPFLQYPTTLLSMVDSSVGGKVGVNHPLGKNLIGSFYQPNQVLIDTSTLKTLPKGEITSGLAEILKYGMIWDKVFFQYLEDELEGLIGLQDEILVKTIKRCCEIKGEVVSLDEKEGGLRTILNYGHTLGHALEAASSYSQFTHGEAVAIGISFALELALHLDLIEPSFLTPQLNLLKKAGLPIVVEGFTLKDLLPHLYQDKKRKGGVLHFILPVRIGEVHLYQVKDEILKGTLKEFLKGDREWRY